MSVQDKRPRPAKPLTRSVDSVFDRLFPPSWEDQSGPSGRIWSPRIDVSESDAAYWVLIDLPGIEPDDVSVELDGPIVIQGTRRAHPVEGLGDPRLDKHAVAEYHSVPCSVSLKSRPPIRRCRFGRPSSSFWS